MLVERLRELVVLVPAQLAGEYFQFGAAGSGFGPGRAEEHVHLGAALRILVGEIHSGESHAARVPSVSWPDGVVEGGLRGKGKGAHPVVAQVPHVIRNAVRITGEDVVKQLCCRKKVVVMRWVLLVPEDGRNAAGTAPLNKPDQLDARPLGTGELVLPGAGISVPGRFHEQEIDAGLPQLVTPQFLAQFEQVPFERKGRTGEIVQDHAHAQVRAPRSRTGSFVWGELQLPVWPPPRPLAR